MREGQLSIGDARQRRFHVRQCLGRGGFGEVYRATMMSPGGLKNEVAIKILRDATPDALKRLRDEGKLLAALRHPAILRAHDLAALDGKVALVTEYVEGEDLQRCITVDQPGRMPLRAVAEVIGMVAEALHVAFTTVPPDGTEPLRLVHRDIKPSNVRVGKHGEIKLLDFGIAWSQDADREARTNANTTVGSLAYMAPERFSKSPAHTAADIYALGCTLYEGITGSRLYPDAVPVEMYQRAADPRIHDEHLAERFAELPADLDPRLRDLLSRMLSHVPDGRPNAAQVAATCEALADELPGSRLKYWCRERDWPDHDGGSGPLSGQTLTEETLPSLSGIPLGSPGPRPPQSTLDMALYTAGHDLPNQTAGMTFEVPTADEIQTSEPVAPPPPSRRWAAVAALVVVLGTVGAVGWFVAGPSASDAAGSAVQADPTPPPGEPPAEAASATTSPEPPPVEAPPAEVAPEPPPAEPKAEAPVRNAPEKPAPTKASSTKTSTTKASATTAKTASTSKTPGAGASAETPPPPEPKPEPSRPPGTVRLVGDPDIAIQLRNGTATRGIGSDVPAGTWDVHADFGHGFHPIGRVDVLSGGTSTIRCNKLRYTCTVE